MSVYTQARIKVTVCTVLISLTIIIASWSLLFLVDYMMFNNNRPILFGTTKIQDIDGTRVITETGLGYYAVTYGSDVHELYVFGYKIK